MGNLGTFENIVDRGVENTRKNTKKIKKTMIGNPAKNLLKETHLAVESRSRTLARKLRPLMKPLWIHVIAH